MKCPHCDTPIDEHEATRCLDAWVAEAVMEEEPLYQAIHRTNNEWGTTSTIGEPMSLSECQELCAKLERDFTPQIGYGNPDYSTDMAAAMNAFYKLSERVLLTRDEQSEVLFHVHEILCVTHDGETGEVRYDAWLLGSGDSAPLAICRAALKAVHEPQTAQT